MGNRSVRRQPQRTVPSHYHVTNCVYMYYVRILILDYSHTFYQNLPVTTLWNMGWAVIVLGCSINLGLYMSGVVCELRCNLTTCIAPHVAIAPHDSCNTVYSDPLLPVRHHYCAPNRLLTGYFFVIQKAESASTVAPHPHRCGDVTALEITSATRVAFTIK